MNRPRVLVVEDRPAVLKLMATILENAYDVLTASDGTSALARLGTEHIDVVLTDVRMPDASGFEVLRAARTRAPHTPVVMMTAYANVPDAVNAVKLGAFDYVAKPLDADEVALAVARAVAHAEEHRGQAPRDCGEPCCDELSAGFHRTVEEARERASRDYLEKLMQRFAGNVTHAARHAGITRESLHRVLKKYGVRSERFKSAPPAGHHGLAAVPPRPAGVEAGGEGVAAGRPRDPAAAAAAGPGRSRGA